MADSRLGAALSRVPPTITTSRRTPTPSYTPSRPSGQSRLGAALQGLSTGGQRYTSLNRRPQGEIDNINAFMRKYQGGSSILDQLSNEVQAAVTQGPAQILKAGIGTITAPVRMGIDYVKEGELRGDGGVYGAYKEYAPLANMITDSMENTYRRNIDPLVKGEGYEGVIENWKEASDEGRTISSIFEDVGNAAIVGGAASKVLGSAPRTVMVGSNAEKLMLEGRTFRTPKSAGSAASPMTSGEVIASQRAGAAAARNVAGEIAPTTPLQIPATIPGRGLAGYAARTGASPSTVARISKVGQNVRRATRVLDAPDNLTVGWQFAGVGKLAEAAGKAGFNLAAKIAPRLNERIGEDNWINRIVDADARERSVYAKRLADHNRSLKTAAQRGATAVMTEAKRLELSPTQQAAVLNALDQRYQPLADLVRKLPEDEGRAFVEDYGFHEAPNNPAQRITYEALQEINDYADNPNSEAALNIFRVAEDLKEYMEPRTERALEAGLNPEQLEADLLTPKVDEIRRGYERKRDAAATERSAADQGVMRSLVAEKAHARIARELPEPPNQRALMEQGRVAGQAQVKTSTARAEYARTIDSLNTAVKEYERAMADIERGIDTQTVDLEARVDRLISEANDIEERILRDERRADAVQGLSRATGEVERVDADGNPIPDTIQGEIDDIAGRPEPDISNMPTRSAIIEVSRQIVDEMKVDLWGQMQQRFGRMGLSRVDKNGNFYDWYDQLSTNEKKILNRDGFLTDYDPLATPDQLAQSASDALGRDLSPDQAVDMYLDLARQIEDLRIEQSARMRRQKRGPAGLVQRDAVTGERIVEYGPSRYRTGPPVNDIQVQRIAQTMGLDPRIIDAAVNGTAENLRRVFADVAREGYDDIRSSFDNLEVADKQLVIDGARATAEQGGNVLDYLIDTLDIDQQTAAVIDGTVSGDALVAWLEGTDTAPPAAFIRAVTEPAGPAQARLKARLQQTLRSSRQALRENYARQREMRQLLDRSRGLDADRIDDAAGRVDIAEIQAEAAAARLEDIETRPSLADSAQVTSKLGDAWKRTRILVDPQTGKAVDRTYVDLATGKRRRIPESELIQRGARPEMRPARAEIVRIREGRAQQLRLSKQRQRQQVARRVQRLNDKIAKLPEDLRKSMQDVLIEDINAPAVRSLFGQVRREGKPLGAVVPPIQGRPPSLTGLMESIVRKHRGSEGVNAVAADMYSQGPPASVGELYDRFLNAAADHGVDIVEGTDAFRDLRDSMQAEYALEAMRMVQDQMGDTHLMAPHAIIAEMRRHTQGFSQEARNALDSRVEAFYRKRTNALRNMTSDRLMVMPERWREVARANMPGFETLLERAEKHIDNGDFYIADLYQELAMDMPTTIEQMMRQGMDPAHLVGGKAPDVSQAVRTGANSSIGNRRTRGSQQSRSGGRPQGLYDYLRLDLDEQARLIDQASRQAIQNHPGLTKRADAIEGVAQFYDEFKADNRGNLPDPKNALQALDEAGWARVPGDDSPFGPQTPVIPKMAVSQFSGSDMASRKWPVRALSKLNTGFKYSVLPFSPLWHIGNVVGNMFMSVFGLGKVSVLDMPRLYMQAVKQSGGIKAFWEQGGLASWAPDQLASHGLSYGEHQLLREGWDAAKPENLFKKFVNQSYAFNEFMDNSFRSIMYADQMQKIARDPSGKTRLAERDLTPSEAAVEHTLRALGDFTNMTSFEKRYVREVFPFYAWLRHQTLMTMRMPVYSPIRTIYLMALTDLLEDEDMADEWYRMMGSRIPLAGNMALNLGGISPFVTPWNMPLDPTNLNNLTSSITPAIKLPVQAITGYDITNLRGTTRPYDERPTDDYGREVPSPPVTRLLSDPIGAAKEIGYVTSNALPQVRAVRETVDTLANDNVRPARYGSGARVGDGQYDDPSRTALDAILAGLRLPRPEDMTKRLDDLTQRILEGR